MSRSGLPPGGVAATTTFFSVSAAVQPARPPRRRALASATNDSIVGVSGVSCATAGGCAPGSAGGTGGVTTASVLAAYSQAAQPTKVSSPTGVAARNSSEAEPPIAPDTADTTVKSRPSRRKIRWYASRTRAYASRSPSSWRSNE
jgi:hypothetical protein